MLKVLNVELQDCCMNLTSDGEVITSLSYFDETSAFLQYVDMLWYHQCFDELGKPHGIQTNYSKTKVLTSTTGSSPYLSQFVSP
jgi:hypothetical protein